MRAQGNHASVGFTQTHPQLSIYSKHQPYYWMGSEQDVLYFWSVSGMSILTTITIVANDAVFLLGLFGVVRIT